MREHTVLSVAYPFAPVRHDVAGGAEQVLLMLDRALTEAGHNSIVAACEGSIVNGTLIETPSPKGAIDAAEREKVHRAFKSAIKAALREFDVDLIHMHGLDFHNYIPEDGTPVLVTLHLPVSWYPDEALSIERPRTYFNCISSSQRRSTPAGLRLLPDIENGVPVDDLRAGISKGNYALCLGRVCPEKGYHIAIDSAKRASVPLFIAGNVFRYESHEEYFFTEILPRLDGKDYRFLGPVGFGRKKRLLSCARCLVVPSLAPETSSLVAMEAMACGTPVVAFPAGALAEIIEDNRTGFLVKDEYEMSRAIREARRISPEVCRKTARERFSSRDMVDRYMEVYEYLAADRAGLLFS